jgi:hypothetical protein
MSIKKKIKLRNRKGIILDAKKINGLCEMFVQQTHRWKGSLLLLFPTLVTVRDAI